VQVGVHRGINNPLRRGWGCPGYRVESLEDFRLQSGIGDYGALLGVRECTLEIRRVPSGPGVRSGWATRVASLTLAPSWLSSPFLPTEPPPDIPRGVPPAPSKNANRCDSPLYPLRGQLISNQRIPMTSSTAASAP
jgi:hypothetical protein